jgi:hypothetical protein
MTMTKTKRISSVLLVLTLASPVVAVAGVASLWPGTSVGEPAPQMSGVPTALRDRLNIFDDLDFRVYSTQQWQDVHLSHADDVVVHWPNGYVSEGLAQHIEDMKWMFTFAPDTRIEEHPVRFGTNDAEWTAVTSFLEGTFTQPMTLYSGEVIQPTGKTFRLPMVTIGHWNSEGRMDEEYLSWDNQSLFDQIEDTK